MKELSFKYYPPKILILIVCIVIALNFLFNIIWSALWDQEVPTLLREFICIASASSLVTVIISFINTHCMWNWYLRLLNLHDIRGTYTGNIISSYHVNDDPNNSHIKLYCKLKVIQNLNKISISCSYYSDKKLTQQTSSSSSSWEDIKKDDDGTFIIRYAFMNEGRQLHPHHSKYNLTNHSGMTVLTFHPDTNEMKGYYFTRERSSHGEISLKRV